MAKWEAQNTGAGEQIGVIWRACTYGEETENRMSKAFILKDKDIKKKKDPKKFLLVMGSGAGNLTAIAGRQRWVHGREAEPIRYETGDGQLDLQGMGNRFVWGDNRLQVFITIK